MKEVALYLLYYSTKVSETESEEKKTGISSYSHIISCCHIKYTVAYVAMFQCCEISNFLTFTANIIPAFLKKERFFPNITDIALSLDC